MKFLFLALSLFATSAFADTSALANSLANSASQSGSASIASQGNAQNITINGSPIPINTTHTQNVNATGTSTVKTVPQVYAPSVGVTAPCRVALSGGVSVIGFGIAAGGSVTDSPCNLRELSRLYFGIGQTDKAVAVANGALALECADEQVAKALGDTCYPKPEPVAVAPAPVVTKVEPRCVTEVSQSGIKTTTCK